MEEEGQRDVEVEIVIQILTQSKSEFELAAVQGGSRKKLVADTKADLKW